VVLLTQFGNYYILSAFVYSTLMMVKKATEIYRWLLKQDKAYCMNVHLLVYCIIVIRSRIVPVRNNCAMRGYKHFAPLYNFRYIKVNSYLRIRPVHRYDRVSLFDIFTATFCNWEPSFLFEK